MCNMSMISCINEAFQIEDVRGQAWYEKDSRLLFAIIITDKILWFHYCCINSYIKEVIRDDDVFGRLSEDR